MELRMINVGSRPEKLLASPVVEMPTVVRRRRQVFPLLEDLPCILIIQGD